MASGGNRSDVYNRQRSPLNTGPYRAPSASPHTPTSPTTPHMKMLGSGPSVIFSAEPADRQSISCMEINKRGSSSLSSLNAVSISPEELKCPKGDTNYFKTSVHCSTTSTSNIELISYGKISPSVDGTHTEELHDSNRNNPNLSPTLASDTRRGMSNDGEFDEIKRGGRQWRHFPIDSIIRPSGEFISSAKAIYSEEINVLSQQGVIFFGKEESDTFISDIERNYDVTIDREVVFGDIQNKVTKRVFKESFLWSSYAGKELTVEKNRMGDGKLCVIPVLAETEGHRFSRNGSIIQMPVSPLHNGQKRDKLESVISSLFNKLNDGKETQVEIVLTPLSNWPFEEYLICFVECSVRWLLGLTTELPRSVTLLADSINHFKMADAYIEQFVTSMQKDLKMKPVIRVLQHRLDQTEADVLVNTTGPSLDLSIGNVSIALSQAVGHELQRECRSLYPRGITPDEIAITKGFNLMCKELFHITLPYYKDDTQCIESIRKAMKLCLEKAADKRHETIAFPIIGSGNMGYPIDLVRSEMFISVERFKHARPVTTLEEVRFVVYPKDKTDMYEKFKKEELKQKEFMTELLHCEVKLKITGYKGHNVSRAKVELERKNEYFSVQDSTASQQKILRENMSKHQMNEDRKGKNKEHSRATGAVPKKPIIRRQFSWSKDAHNLEIYENGSLIIKVYKADILKVPTEGIVNAANENLLHIGGIARSIAKHAGEQLKYESHEIVRNEGPLKVSTVVSTSGGNLHFECVLHAVGPRWRDYEPFTEINVQKCADDLKQTVLSCLRKAESMPLKTLVMPTISSGIFKVPKNVCAVQYASAILDFDDNNNSLQEIHIVDIDSDMVRIVQKIFYTMFTERKPAPDCLREFIVAPVVKPTIKEKARAKVKKFLKQNKTDKKGKHESQSDDTGTAEQTSEVEVEDCVICMDKVTDGKTLKCGHVFCSECIDGYFRVKMVCPTCGQVCGTITGDQPTGVMRIDKTPQTITGYEGCKSFAITYRFQDGRQGPNHPKPGDFYKGISRTAFLPDNDEGRKICAMLKVAFERRLVFTIGTSRTTGQEGVITWNDIHHKTDLRPHTQFGYPDATYLQRVQEELEVKGVTIDDINDKFIDELKKKDLQQLFPCN